MSRRKHLAEVETAIRKLPRAKKPEKWMAKNYIGAGESALEFLDLTAPTLRARLRDGFAFESLPVSEQWRIWDFVWKNSPTFEVMNGALEFAQNQSSEELFKHRKTLFTWVKRSDNWAHSDGLSSIYTQLLEHDRPAILPRLHSWSKSRNPWERRQSLVSLLYYASGRKKDRVLPFRSLIAMVELHVEDSHYYVQKGVGWTIREIYNLYPRETYAWLLKNIHRLAAPAWQAATEKLSPADKSRLKLLRKKSPRGPKKK
jgi:3-methyladenine DNA glycosylase AlkD